jgi:hypothetical protein
MSAHIAAFRPRYILPKVGEISLTEFTTRLLMDLRDYLLHEIPRREARFIPQNGA